MLRYAPLMVKHHWTPKQIDEEVPASLLPWIIPVENLLEELGIAQAEKRL